MRRLLPTLTLLLGLAAPAGAELTADNLLLVVNKNVPASRELADYYADARNVPDGRIVEVDVPDADDIKPDVYDAQVASVIRDFLETNGLVEQVTCVVPVYGVPLRVSSRGRTRAENEEWDAIAAEGEAVLAKLNPPLERAAGMAGALGRPVPADLPFGTPLQKAVTRLELAERQIQAGAQAISESERAALGQQFAQLRAALVEPLDATAGPMTEAEKDELRAALQTVDSADGRRRARELAKRAGLVDYARTLAQQQNRLDTDDSGAALDSELATLWTAGGTAARWMTNPLVGNLRFADRGDRPLMVCRLDAINPQQVRDLIATSVLVENEGLSGTIVVDSRGLQIPRPPAKPDGYAPFDQNLRDLAVYLKENASLPLVHDDNAAILKRSGDRFAAENVAVYVGWYQVRKYEPAFAFARGAVGYHVASFEMLSLHENKGGWVRGLLNDGVVGTLGPVAEPYLSAFPLPTAFVPLLLSGELTLAEVYWSTNPMVSWKVALIGDPLYTPFRKTPAVAFDALPAPLQRVIATRE